MSGILQIEIGESEEQLRWNNFDDLAQLRQKVTKIISFLTSQTVASIIGWQFILDALSVTSI